jgi:serine phosphatase RsbU (regulator of sigma subunit)
MKCTFCNAELSVGTRVCKSCGHPVYNNPTLEDLYFSRLASNAPPKLVQKVRSAAYLTKERRSVTAVMLTIANLESINAVVPEDERSPILNDALDRIASVIYQFEGAIAKLWENTVLAFFGAPVTHEDDPLRAVHASSATLEEIHKFSDTIEEKYGVPFQINMILNSGPILIGEVKSNLKFDFQSLNNTLECMDMAIQAAIPQCETILLEDTFRFVKPFVQCTKLDDLYCEELADDLHLWRVDRVKLSGLNNQRAPITRNTPLVGRARELDLLLELSETVLAGLGRVGLILGEPGVGKSRLILEWKRRLKSLHQPTKLRWIEGHGIAFGRELAYHLLKSLLHSALDIPENASAEEIDKVLKNKLDDLLGVDQEILYTYLAHLLDIRLDELQEKHIHQLNARDLHAQYLNSIRSFFRALALEQPVIILLEDLHWADVSSVNLLIDLLSIATVSPVLICLVTRPDRESEGWKLVMAAREQIGPRLTEFELGNLDKDESQSLVKELLDIEEIPEIIRTVVLNKSEGNPYFIEELLRMLINEEVLVQKEDRWIVSPHIDPNKVPDSLQGLLAARIDRLPPDARLTLRVASVIGRRFPERVIEKVLSTQSPNVKLMPQLSTLESIGMIKVAQVHPELSYSFQHILLHDAAYHSIVEEDRSTLHRLVGVTLEEHYPEQIDRLASQLAFHFSEGNLPDKAFTYLDKAGHVSMESFANAEAEHYFKQAVRLTDDPESLAHLYTDLGEALAQQGKHREAIQIWEKAIGYHDELVNYDRLARVHAWAARSAWWGYDPKLSLEICLRGLEVVKGAVESADIAYLIHETGRAYLFNNQPDKARTYCEQALEMAKRLDAFDVQSEALATIGILPNIKPQQAIAALEMAVKISESKDLFGPASRAYINLAAVIDNLGEVRLARDYRKRAIQLGTKAGGVTDETLVNHAIINASLWLGDFNDAQERIEQLRQEARQNNAYLDDHTLNQLFQEGSLQRMKGDFTQAIDTFTDLIDRSRQINDVERVLQGNRALAEIILESYLLEDGNPTTSNIDIAFSMVNEAKQAVEQADTVPDVSTQCILSSIFALKGNLARSEAALDQANNLYRSQPAMHDRVRIVLAQARLEIARGNFEDALEYLANGVDMLDKMEGRWWRARVWLEMGVIYLKRNEPEDIDQAQNLFREALSEFRELGVEYYPDLIIEKLRQVKRVSRAQAIAHKKVTQELAQAGRVQNTFIPTQSPALPDFQISGVLLPAHETSGDFYDFIELDDGKLGIVIADVGDKGAGAALYMAMSRTLIRTYAGEEARPPDEVIREVNRRILSDTQKGIFLTAVYGILDPQTSTFTYVNAGHNPPCLLSKEDEEIKCAHLDRTGTLVGIFAGNTWETKTVTLTPSQTLVLYTDGITEAQDETGEFYGYDRLVESLQAGFGKPAEEFRNSILESVQAFTGTAPRLDDITLIVIQRE